MADSAVSSGLTQLSQAASGKLSFFKQGVIMPVVVGSAAGGGAVVVGRYFTRKLFVKKNADGTYQRDAAGGYVDEDSNSKLKRGAVKIALGLAGASVVRKYSPPAALGIALGLGVDGVADMIQSKGFEYMDKWFTPSTSSSTTTTTTGAGVGGTYGGGRTWSREVQ